MGSKRPSTITTAGAGFANEDAVGAHAALCLLAGRPYLDASLGSPTTVQFQTRWPLDDMLVESRSPFGVHRAAISIKLRETVTTDGFPRDFVRRCWQLALDSGAGFDPNRDLLVLASNRPSPPVRAAVGHEVAYASANPDGYSGDLGSALGRRIFDSFSRPPEFNTSDSNPPNTAKLLATVRVLDFDFLDPNSESTKECSSLCRTLVQGGSAADADRLWTDLQEHVKGLRPSGGRITLGSLLQHLRIRGHRLMIAPDYRHAWSQLDTLSKRNLSDVRDVIGAQIHLERPQLQEELRNAVALNRFTVLLGRSGTGKSSTLKDLAARRTESQPVFLLTPEDVERLENRPHEVGVDHPLSTLPATQPAQDAVLILDGLDRVFETGVEASVRRLIRALRLDADDTNWRLVVSSQPHEWERLSAAISELPPTTPIRVPPLDTLERAALLSQAPDLAPLFSATAGRVLYTLKVIDLVARSRTTPSRVWVGDADALTAWWESVVVRHDRAFSLERTVTRIGRMQAEGRTRFVALQELDAGDTDVIRDLERLGILTSRDGLVSFEHALIGDYARARYLLGLLLKDEPTLNVLLEQPEWRSAFLLVLALHLEAAARTGSREELLRLLARIPGNATIDLLCDAAVAPPCSDRLLPVLDPLLASEGFLFRLLLRVWASTTSPLELRPEVAKSFTLQDRVFWSREARLPVLPLWTPAVGWLLSHQEMIRTTVPLGFVPIVQAGLDWPQRLGFAVPLQAELAGVALEIAADFHEDRYRRDVEGSDLERLFLMALLGARYHPERFRTVARELAGLVPPAKAEDVGELPDPWPRDDYESTGSPWPDGPLTRPHRTFSKVALSALGARALARLDSSLAREIFLALLIAPPGLSGSSSGRDDLQIERDGEGQPCHDFAPLQSLLETDAHESLEFLNRLINFATARYVEVRQRPRFEEAVPARPPTPGVSLRVGSYERFFTGDAAVFGWYGGVGMHSVIGSALMTLEHHLYSLSDADRDRWIRGLLTRSDSVAALGILSALAIKAPELLDGPLRPLLDDPVLLKFAQLAAFEVARTPVPGTWPGETPDRARQRYDWRQLPQHQTDLLSAFLDWLHARRFNWEPLAEVRARWTRCRDRAASSTIFRSWCDDLLYRTDAGNWRPVRRSDGEEILLLADSGRFQAGREELARQESTIRPWSIAVQCLTLLERGEPLSPEQIEGLTALLDVPDPPPGAEALIGPVNVRGIAAATLLANAGSSPGLTAPLRLRCDALVMAMTLNPPAPNLLDSRRSPCLACWDFFAASALPEMMAHSGLTPSIRHAFSMLVLAPHDQAVSRFLSRVAGEGRLTETEFESLLHLVVLAARLQYLASWASTRLPVLVTATREYLARVKKAYQRGRLAPVPAAWSGINELVPSSRRPWTRFRLWRDRRALNAVPARTDCGLLRAAFTWVADDLDHLSANRRRRRSEYVLELRRALTSPADEGDRPDRTAHYESHLLVGRSVAALLLAETDPKERRALFSRFFERKGQTERQYPEEEIIIESLFRNGLLGENEHPSFRRVHSELFLLCFGSDGVLLGDANFVGVRTLAERFLGAGMDLLNAIWSAERVELFEALEPTWRRWMGVFFCSWSCGTAFLRLLRTPAAATRRLVFLSLIGPKELEDPGDDERFDEALLHLLQVCWDEDGSDLLSDAAAREAFRCALRRLVERGIPDAVLLEQRVASSWALG